MATETEELKLIVSLVDQATPGLKEIQKHVASIGGVEVKRAHELARKEANETREVVKRLTGDLGEAFKALGAFRGGLVAGAGGLALFGFEMAKQMKDLKEYTDKLKEIKLTAGDIGADPAELKNIVDQYKAVGVSQETVLSGLKSISERVAELQRLGTTGSPFWTRMMQEAGRSPGSQEAMRKFLDDLAHAHTKAEQLNLIREKGEQVEANARKQNLGEQEAADRKQRFYAELGYNNTFEQLKHITALTEAQLKAERERIDNAQAYSNKLNEISKQWDHIIETLRTPIFDRNSPVMKGLDYLIEKLKLIEDAAEKVRGKPGEGRKPFDTTLEQIMRDELDKAKSATEHEKKLDDNTKALERLNDAFDAFKQGGVQQQSFLGGGVANALLHQAMFTTGGGGGGAPYGGGGGAPYGSRAAPGGNTGGAATDTPAGGGPAATGLSGNRRETAQIVADEWRRAGMSEEGLAGIMANIRSESNFNPTLRHPDQPRFSGEAHFAHGLYQEGGEEWNNYAAWLKQNHPGADWRDPRLQSRFAAERLKAGYPGVWRKMMGAHSGGEAAQAYVRGYLKPAAGPMAGRIRQYGHGVPSVESYTGPMDEHGASSFDLGGARRRLDAASGAKISATGKLTVDVNAPKGTHVGAEGGGLFKNVEINRQTQMDPADRGPASFDERFNAAFPR